jgi:DNA-binding transcriptional LysR family regulator
MSRFDFNLLRSLGVLLKEKNVTAAANKLAVSQSTMSGMLQRLRLQFKDQLLVRDGQTYSLTVLAEELSDKVNQTLLEIDSLMTNYQRVDISAQKRHFVIMASEFSMIMILPYLFQRAEDAAPHMTFEVVQINDPAASVYSGDVDFCLTGDTIEHINGNAALFVHTKTVALDGFVAVVDDNHPVKNSLSLEEFKRYPHVATQFPGIPRTVEDNGITGFSEKHPPKIRVPSFLAIGPIVIGTNLIGVVPARMAPMLLNSWNLRTVNLPEVYAKTSLKALWHSRYAHDQVHQWLRTEVFKACARLAVDM